MQGISATVQTDYTKIKKNSFDLYFVKNIPQEITFFC